MKEPKLIRATIAFRPETDLDDIDQFQLIRLIAKAIPRYNINSQAQDQLVSHFTQYADALQYVITLQTRIVPSRDPIKWKFQIANAAEDTRYFWKRINYSFGVSPPGTFPQNVAF